MKKAFSLILVLILTVSMIPLAAFGAAKKPAQVKLTSAEITDYDGDISIVTYKWDAVKCTGYQGCEAYQGDTCNWFTKNTSEKGEYAAEQGIIAFRVRAYNSYKQKQYLNTKNKWVTKKPKKYKKTRTITKKLYGKWSNVLKVNIATGKDVPEKKDATSILNKPMGELSESELREGIRSELEKLVIAAGGENYYKGGKIVFVAGPENTAKGALDIVNTKAMKYGSITYDVPDKEYNKAAREYGSPGEGVDLRRNHDGTLVEGDGPFGGNVWISIYHYNPSTSINTYLKDIKKVYGKDIKFMRALGIARDNNHIIIVLTTQCAL